MKPARLLTLGLLVAVVTSGAVAATPKKAKSPARGTRSTKPVNDSDRVLVRIGDDVITPRHLAARLLELPEQYRGQYSTPEGRKQLLDRLIEERVWLRDADANGVTRRPELLSQIEAQKRDLLIRTWVNEVMAKNAPPSDSEARAYYEDHLEEWKTPANVTLRHIQLKTERDAKRVLGLARAKNADWDKLAKQHSVDTLTRANGGSLGTATREGGFAGLGPQPALAESALACSAGTIAGPWRTDKGWHVVKVDAVRPESVRDFDQVRSFIVRQMGQERSQRFYRDQLQLVREKYRVSPDSAEIQKWISAKKSARELFQDAQGAGDVMARVAAYRKVVDEYPEADVSPQSLFMVGFIHSEELKNYDEAERIFRELLQRYPGSELAPSAQWMVEHMRTDDVPDFLGVDSSAAAGKKKPVAKDGGR